MLQVQGQLLKVALFLCLQKAYSARKLVSHVTWGRFYLARTMAKLEALRLMGECRLSVSELSSRQSPRRSRRPRDPNPFFQVVLAENRL